jgi:hypothetical protein
VKITECGDIEFYSNDKLQYFTVENVIKCLLCRVHSPHGQSLIHFFEEMAVEIKQGLVMYKQIGQVIWQTILKLNSVLEPLKEQDPSVSVQNKIVCGTRKAWGV